MSRPPANSAARNSQPSSTSERETELEDEVGRRELEDDRVRKGRALAEQGPADRDRRVGARRRRGAEERRQGHRPRAAAAEHPRDRLLGDEGLHGRREEESEGERPQHRPEHGEREAQRVAGVSQNEAHRSPRDACMRSGYRWARRPQTLRDLQGAPTAFSRRGATLVDVKRQSTTRRYTPMDGDQFTPPPPPPAAAGAAGEGPSQDRGDGAARGWPARGSGIGGFAIAHAAGSSSSPASTGAALTATTSTPAATTTPPATHTDVPEHEPARRPRSG